MSISQDIRAFFLVSKALLAALVISLSFPITTVAEADQATETVVTKKTSSAEKDWVTDFPLGSCSLQCQLCDGFYQAPPLRDLDLNSDKPNAIFAAADDYEYDKSGNAKLLGDVVLQQGQLQLEAEQVDLFQEEQRATAKGNVRVRDQGFLLEGDSATLELKNKDATIENASYLDHASGIQGRAKTLTSTQNSVQLTIKEGYYTSCPRNSEDWYLRGKEIKLDQESGWGTAKHMRLHFKKVPLFYAPYLKFPIDDRRHTGLLVPNIDVKEPDISQPFYWNIAPNYDATITPRHIGSRGQMLDTQFRYLTFYGAGEFNTGYLSNDSSFDNEDRKLFNWTHQTFWEDQWEFDAETTYLSDYDYFKDLGSDLSVNSQSHLNRQARFRYYNQFLGASSTVSLWVQAFQTIDDSISDANRPYRRLPEIEWTLRWPIQRHLSWSQTIELTRFEQLYKADYQESDRARFSGTLSYRWENPWSYIAPAAQLNHVTYQHRQHDDSLTEDQSLSVPTVWVNSGIFLERLVKPFNTKFLQTLEPRAYFLWTPFREQNDHPNFDTSALTFDFNQLFRSNRFVGGDRYGDTKQVTLALTSRLINTESGDEQFTASIGQAYYFADREVQLSGDAIDESDLSPVASRLSWHPLEQWRWQLDAQWDSERNKFDSGSNTISFLGKDRWQQTAHIINLGYRYVADEDDRIEQGELSSANKLSKNWTLHTRWLFDLENRNTLEQLTGLSYESCCWRSSLLYQRRVTDVDDSEDPESRYNVHIQLELKGLASLGGKIDRLLGRGIKNYEEFFGKK